MSGNKNILSVMFMVLAFLVSPFFSAEASPYRDDGPTTVGHRGTTVIADENTIVAFRAAWEHGLDIFECDPKLSADGVYVIMHDSSVDRTTDGTGPVEEMTLEEIKRLRTENGHQVPTLEEALIFARDHKMAVYLDIKDPPADGGVLLVEVIERTGMIDRVIAGCWHKKTCRMIEAVNPAISTCIAWPWPALTLGQAKRLGADAVGTLLPFATKHAIKRAHKKGLRMITMPINTKEQIEKFKARGLDAIQTDDPRLIGPAQ